MWPFSFVCDKQPEVPTAGSYGSSTFIVLQETAKPFSTVVVPTSSIDVMLFLCMLPSVWWCHFFKFYLQQWFLLVVLISLMANDVECLFLCLFAIYLSSLLSVDVFCPFSNWFLLLLNIDSSLCSLSKSFGRYVGHKCFLPVCSFSFHYFTMVLPRAKVFKWVPSDQLFSFADCAFVSTLRTHCLFLGPDDCFSPPLVSWFCT